MFNPAKPFLPRLRRALLLGALLIGSSATIPATQAAVPLPGNFDIPCAQSPFGHVLNLGVKDQVFISVSDALDPGRLNPYRFVADPAASLLQPQFVADFATQPSHISALASTSADLDGDGKAEFVQGFTDATGQYTMLVNKNGSSQQTHVESWPGHTQRAMAAGDILGLDNGSQQVVVASQAADGSLTVAVFAGAPGGGVGSPVAQWSTTASDRLHAAHIRVAVGNLDNDGYADIVVSLLQSDNHTAQLIYLEYQQNYQSNSGGIVAQSLQERVQDSTHPNSHFTYFVGGSGGAGPKDVQLTLANLAGNNQDRVVLAWDQAGGLGGLSPMLSIRNFDYSPALGFSPREQWSGQSNSLNFALASGAVIGNYRDQLVVAYDTEGGSTFGHLNIDTIALTAQDTPNPTLSTINHWEDAEGYRNQANDLALAVGDTNRDNRAEVVTAFKDANQFGFQTILLSEQVDQNKTPLGLKLITSGRNDTTVNSPISITMGDWDNESLRATVGGKCAHLEEPTITGVGFVPPSWQNMGQSRGGSMGIAVNQEKATESSLTYSRSQTISAYVGISAGVSFFDLAEFSASAKATGAQEYATSNTRTNGSAISTETTVGRSWNDDALVYEAAEYNCYSYQLAENGTPISANDALLRFCEYLPLPGNQPQLSASELNSWDTNFSQYPEYIAAVRDWSSLALFRGPFTDQSSNKASAALAVDSQIVNGSFANGTPAQTANENHPWWQVDLGTTQPLSSIRLWTPSGSLSNFYVFVSNTDFRSIPGGDDPQTLLNQPGVQHYTLADLGNGLKISDTARPETTFSLPQNSQGRYLRVQRADAGVLTLAEVQVFGGNHVEPDRYPVDMRDTTPGDGMFEVRMYNPSHTSDADMYVWIPVRGNLSWDGRVNDVLNSLNVERGSTYTDWSMSNNNVITKVQSQEIANNTTVGAEFDIEGGVGVKIQTGGGVERTTGIASEIVQSTSWGNGFNMGGQVQNFPSTYDGQSWVLNCRYRFQPYYYEVTESSNTGFQQRFPVLDYLVPTGRSRDLTRTNDLASCRNGNQTSDTPQTSNDNAQTLPGQPLTLNVLANDLGDNLAITDVGTPQHGTVTHTARTIIYTPNAGFMGTDTFTYSIGGGAVAVQADTAQGTTTGSVTVNVGAFIYLPVVRR